jgi:hypothetical protein
LKNISQPFYGGTRPLTLLDLIGTTKGQTFADGFKKYLSDGKLTKVTRKKNTQ